jgi:hypothetical protein
MEPDRPGSVEAYLGDRRGVRGAEPPLVGQTTVVVPPAASIFSFAEPENACALTWTATEMSP